MILAINPRYIKLGMQAEEAAVLAMYLSMNNMLADAVIGKTINKDQAIVMLGQFMNDTAILMLDGKLDAGLESEVEMVPENKTFEKAALALGDFFDQVADKMEND